MPISLDNSGPVASVTARGAVTYCEIHELFTAMLREAPRVPGLAVFVDTREVTAAPSTAELRRVAAEFRQVAEAGFGPIAVLTDSAWMYGVVRMFSVFVQGATDVVAVRSADDAAVWVEQHAVLRKIRLGEIGTARAGARKAPTVARGWDSGAAV